MLKSLVINQAFFILTTLIKSKYIMRKILSFLMLLIFVNLYAQSASVRIDKIKINNSEYGSNGFSFNPVNGTNSFTIDCTVKGDDKRYGYTILDVKLYVNNQFYASNGGFFISGTSEVKKSFNVSMNGIEINKLNKIPFKIEIVYRPDVFPQKEAKTSTTTWTANVLKPIDPIGNNSINTPTIEFDENGTNRVVTFTGSVPTGGNGNYKYVWYRQDAQDNYFKKIDNAIGKDLTISINNTTKIYRQVFSNNDQVNGKSNHITIKFWGNISNKEINYNEYSQVVSKFYYDLKSLNNIQPDIIKGQIPTTYTALNSTENIEYIWQKSSDQVNWSNLINGSNKDMLVSDLIEQVKNENDVYIRRVVTSNYSKNSSISNIVEVKKMDIADISNNVISRNGYAVNGNLPTGGVGSFYYHWGFKCLNETEKGYYALGYWVNNVMGGAPKDYDNFRVEDIYNDLAISEGYVNTLRGIGNLSTMNCEGKYKLVRIVNNQNIYSNIINPQANIAFGESISNEILITSPLSPLGEWSNVNFNIITEKSNVSLLLDVNNISNKNLKLMVWDISNPSLFNEFNVKATSKQIKLNKTFNKGIYAYKVLDSNNIIVKEGKFVIK